MPGATTAASVLRVTGLSKAYNGVLALDGVDLDVRPGEVHALLGGNGSGKSTLIKVLAGVVDAEDGAVLHLGDEQIDLGGWTGDKAYAAGLRFVHQQPAVFSDLSIAENIAFGTTFPKTKLGKIDRRSAPASCTRRTAARTWTSAASGSSRARLRWRSSPRGTRSPSRSSASTAA